MSMSESSGKADAAVYPPAPEFDAAFRLSADGVLLAGDPALNRAVREAFSTFNGAVFLNVIEASLLDVFLRLARAAAFESVATDDWGLRGVDAADRIALPFCMALARPVLLRWLEAVTGCEPLATVEGLIARMAPGDILEWHRDARLGVRRLAVVIHLTEVPYEGGRFELRTKQGQWPLMSCEHRVPGSTAIFRLGLDLQHRVTPVTSGGPRTIFAGWFRGPVQAGDGSYLPTARNFSEGRGRG
jgi:hypothetical protein